MDKDIFEDIYNEFRFVSNEIARTSKEIEKLVMKREILVDIESRLRCVLLDYGDIHYERYEPKYEPPKEED